MYKAIDLFAGIGGIRLGFGQAFGDNIEFVFSAEIDKFSCKTYQENFGEDPLNDIIKINELDIPSHDILLAGFPCQAFSISGRRGGFEDTRGTLFFDVARILRAKKPKTFLLENVKGLISHDKENTFNVILNTLKDIGYKVFYKVLNSKDFGLPQNRERIFIVGFLDKEVDFEFPTGDLRETKIKDILEHDVDEKYTISDVAWKGHKSRKE